MKPEEGSDWKPDRSVLDWRNGPPSREREGVDDPQPTTPEEAARLLTRLDRRLAPLDSTEREAVLSQMEDPNSRLQLQYPGTGDASAVLVCTATGQVWQEGRLILKLKTTLLSWRLVVHLLRNRGQQRPEIYPAVWNTTYRSPSSDNVLNVCLCRLRKRLEGSSLVIDVDKESRYSVRGDPSVWIWSPDRVVLSEDCAVLRALSEPIDAPVSMRATLSGTTRLAIFGFVLVEFLLLWKTLTHLTAF